MASEDSAIKTVELVVSTDHSGMRLDMFLAQVCPQYSRSHFVRMINATQVLVDQRRVKAAYQIHAGQRVVVTLSEPPRQGPIPQNIPLDLLYEDECMVVVNKPAGMVVHPSKGHWQGTLTSALAFRFKELSSIGGPTRPGIVHRLDRETSGVIVVAKNDATHLKLARQFENRAVEKEYFAIVQGVPDRDRDMIDQPLGVHPYQREKMASRAQHSSSRDAQTFYEVIDRFDGYATVRVFPKTGRTHQIRIHMAHVGCPILCDRLYGGRSRITKAQLNNRASDEGSAIVLDRLALHAVRLSITHPARDETVEFIAPLPEDIRGVVQELSNR